MLRIVPVSYTHLEAVPALGCTEPVACALACAKCKEVLGDVPEHLDVLVSGNIYKNGMGVGCLLYTSRCV